MKQAEAELGQAQRKLGLDFTLIFCRFGFSRFGLIELVWCILFGRFDWKIWFGIFGVVHRYTHFKHFLVRFKCVDLVWQILFKRLGLVTKVQIFLRRFGLVHEV